MALMKEHIAKWPHLSRQPRPSESVVCWDSPAFVDESISVELIESFDARGLKLRYGRGDHFGHRAYHMDVWTNREGRMFVRFWSRSDDVDRESHEIFGISASCLGDGRVEDEFIPLELRKQYGRWIISN